MTKLIGRFKKLNKGVLRLLLVIGILFSLLISPFLTGYPFAYYLDFDESTIELILSAGLAFVGYWVIARIILWIIDGF